MAETITIRTLGPDDADVFDRVRRGVFAGPIDPVQAWAFLSVGVNVIVVAQERGEVVGFVTGTVIFHPDRPRAFFVSALTIHPDLTGQGLERRLMRGIMDVAGERGCERLWMLLGDDAGHLRALCEMLGGAISDAGTMAHWDLELL